MWCLKQYTFLTLQFYKSKFQHRSSRAKTKVSAGLYSFLKALGEKLFPCLFQLLETTCNSWFMAPFPHSQTVKFFSPFFCNQKCCLLLRTMESHWIHWDTPGSSFHVKVPNDICEDPLPCKVTYSHIWGGWELGPRQIRTLGEGHYSAYHTTSRSLPRFVNSPSCST